MTPEPFYFQRHFCQLGEGLVVGSISSSSVFLSVIMRADQRGRKAEMVQEEGGTGGRVGSM